MSAPGRERGGADAALDALRGADPSVPAVTSLSVDEAILLDQIGYTPLSMVTGASVVQVARLVGLSVGFTANGELEELSRALEASRVRAIERITEAGRFAGGDGVVGVSLDVGDLRAGTSLVHLTATGTAVRTGAARRYGRAAECFTAALSGQEVHLLAQAGYAPLGIVSGVCTYHVGRRGFADWAGSVKVNQEMTLYTEALYDARELAMGRLQDMALRLGADGVVGVRLTERSGVWGSHVIEFAALGTAVQLVAGEHRPLEPRMVMDLAGR